MAAVPVYTPSQIAALTPEALAALLGPLQARVETLSQRQRLLASTTAALVDRTDGQGPKKKQRVRAPATTAATAASERAARKHEDDAADEPPPVQRPDHAFWGDVEAHFQEPTASDLAFVSTLMDTGVPRELKVFPPLGTPYAQAWALADAELEGEGAPAADVAMPLSCRLAAALLGTTTIGPPLERAPPFSAALVEREIRRTLGHLALLPEATGIDEVGTALRKAQRELHDATMEACLRYESLYDMALAAKTEQRAARDRDRQLQEVETELEQLYFKYRSAHRRSQADASKSLGEAVTQALARRRALLAGAEVPAARPAGPPHKS
eukprot:m.51179 g.51179  ORF g.51179 m.51179 type:complete len:326 (-) comp6286_c0_seq1:94-1071(-)